MANENNDSQEKTEQATPKRLDEAKQKGQVSRSREFNTMMVLLGSVISLYLISEHLIDGLVKLMTGNFSLLQPQVMDSNYLYLNLIESSSTALLSLAPFLVAVFIIALIAPMAVGGWAFSFQALAPDWSKIDPIAGTKRIFSAKGLMELFKALAKFVLISGVAIVIIWLNVDTFLSLGNNGVEAGLYGTADFINHAFLLLSASTILIALIDVPFQIWQHAKQLKMTKQEVKDDLKETEGKPEVKAQLRSMQQEVANRRMLEDVPTADVVIVNPTHFAVALKYDQEKMAAPKLVAKGVDHMAARIRTTASSADVTIFSAPMLCRAIYHNTKLGSEVPQGLYTAVAQVLAYVYQLRAAMRDPDLPKPKHPGEPAVPEQFRAFS